MQEFSLYQNTKSNGEKYFYVKVKNPETGKYMSEKSVEALRKLLGHSDFSHITSKAKAQAIVYEAIEKGLVGNRPKKIYLKDYLSNFWNFDTPEYIAKENRKRPNAIGRKYAYNNNGLIKNHVLPLIESSLTPELLRKSQLERIQKSVLVEKNLSVKTWKPSAKHC